ncbi:MAG: type II toxin-antitoxin system HigB family toxin [Gammaproteobacteria bacterium]|nr:type II toxin-antitoxin system HigB family toxin [Gammaproteobacteria bacterium]
MRIIAKRTLREFWEKNPTAEEPLRSWYRSLTSAEWDTPAKVKEKFGNASIVANNRVVFRIKGNAYRLVVEIDYRAGIVYVRFIGSHAKYDTINVTEV